MNPEQQMVQVIFGICTNPITVMPMADGYDPACGEILFENR